MSGGSSWRSPSTADQYRDHDFADFAQEFLNRNRDYRKDHARTQSRAAALPHLVDTEQEGLAGRWGLSFPQRSGVGPKNQPSTMVTARRA
ncbi:MAG: hypothetical protein IPN84_15245 [Sphingomonadales bacterium]|nr:hypothetical protein [Sphingomonadales bacterium]